MNAFAKGIFDFLYSIGLKPLEFSKARELTGKPMPYVKEILDAAFAHAQAVVVLLTPDDEARLRPDLIHGFLGIEWLTFSQASALLMIVTGIGLLLWLHRFGRPATK